MAPAIKTVAFSTLCQAEDADLHLDFLENECAPGEGHSRVGGKIFVWEAHAGADEQESTVASFGPSTCSSIKLRFGVSDEDLGLTSSLRIEMTLTQTSGATSTFARGRHSPATLEAKLNGQPWDISVRANVPVAGAWDVYIAGEAKCSTPDGK